MIDHFLKYLFRARYGNILENIRVSNIQIIIFAAFESLILL